MSQSFDPRIMGVIELGSVMTIMLHGAIWTQVYSYHRQFPKDPLLLKSVVTLVWLFSIGHTVCNIAGLYDMTVVNYGKPGTIPQAYPISSLFSAIIQALVQLTYAYRLYKFSERMIIPVIFSAATIFNFVGTLIFAVASVDKITIQQTMAYRQYWSWLIYTVYAATAVLDVAIAGSIAYYLSRGRKGVMHPTAHMVDKLIRWTIETGVITSIFALAIVITFAINKFNNVWLALYEIMTNVYAVTLLALLNGRSSLKTGGSGMTSYATDTNVTSLTFYHAPDSNRMTMDASQRKGADWNPA